MERERLAKIIEFLRVADRLKSVYRVTYLTTEDRHENDAEHTVHMALFALLLMPEIAGELDAAHIYELILAHDLVEIIAGDTYAYDLQARIDAREREERAAQELFALLATEDRERMLRLWHEFEDGDSGEARFARAMDRLQGFAQNVFTQGRAWKEHGISEAMTRDRNQPVMELDLILREACELLYGQAGEVWGDEEKVDSR